MKIAAAFFLGGECATTNSSLNISIHNFDFLSPKLWIPGQKGTTLLKKPQAVLRALTLVTI